MRGWTPWTGPPAFARLKSPTPRRPAYPRCFPAVVRAKSSCHLKQILVIQPSRPVASSPRWSAKRAPTCHGDTQGCPSGISPCGCVQAQRTRQAQSSQKAARMRLKSPLHGNSRVKPCSARTKKGAISTNSRAPGGSDSGEHKWVRSFERQSPPTDRQPVLCFA
jgi:hypothetical protein